MVRVSCVLFYVINILTLLFGLSAVASSIYFRSHGHSVCHRSLQDPILILALFISVVSLLGLIGSCCRANGVLIVYFIAVFLSMLGLIVFTLFALILMKTGPLMFAGHRLANYSSWLREHFLHGEDWNEVRSCLVESQVCNRARSYAHGRLSEYLDQFSPIQSGCCKPPVYCGFHHENGTYWQVPKSGPAVPDIDCTIWSNDLRKLCYDCDSCKREFLVGIRLGWKPMAIVNICILVLVVIIFNIGCCVRRNIKKDQYFRYGINYP